MVHAGYVTIRSEVVTEKIVVTTQKRNPFVAIVMKKGTKRHKNRKRYDKMNPDKRLEKE